LAFFCVLSEAVAALDKVMLHLPVWGEGGGQELAVSRDLLFQSHPMAAEVLPGEEGWRWVAAKGGLPLEGLAPQSQATAKQ